MRGHEIDDGFGYACAEALGLEAWTALGHGQDGKAFALEDGRTLKVTTSPFEVAASVFVMEAQARGDAPALFPRVDHVATTTVGDRTAYVVVREDVADAFVAPDEDDRPAIDAWEFAVRGVAHDWHRRHDWGPPHVDPCVPGHLRLDHVIPALRWFAEGTGCRLDDLKPCAFGVGADGRVLLRDMSRAEDVMDAFLRAYLARVPPLPEAPSPRP